MKKAKENVSVWTVIDQSKKARLSSKNSTAELRLTSDTDILTASSGKFTTFKHPVADFFENIMHYQASWVCSLLINKFISVTRYFELRWMSKLPFVIVPSTYRNLKFEQIIFFYRSINSFSVLIQSGLCEDQYPLGPIHGWTSLGYEKAKKGQICVDINECMEKTPCNYNERCINLDGFYKCLKTSQAGTRNTIFSRTILTHSN